MQTFDQRSPIYGATRTQERVLLRHRKRAIGVRAIEVLPYMRTDVG